MLDVFTAAQSAVQPPQPTAGPPTQALVRSAGGRIIFVNHFFFPDRSATSQILSDLAFHLAGQAIDVRVVTSRQRYDDPHARLPVTHRVGGVAIHRVATTRFGRSALIGRGCRASFTGSPPRAGRSSRSPPAMAKSPALSGSMIAELSSSPAKARFLPKWDITRVPCSMLFFRGGALSTAEGTLSRKSPRHRGGQITTACDAIPLLPGGKSVELY
jgi:hypothetical protein